MLAFLLSKVLLGASWNELSIFVMFLFFLSEFESWSSHGSRDDWFKGYFAGASD